MSEAADPTTGKAVSGDLAGYVTLPAFIQLTGVTHRLGTEALCLIGLCWVEDGRVRLQRYHEKAGLGRRLRNANGYPFDLLSPKGVEYARSGWSEGLSSAERWHRRESNGRAAQAGVSLASVPAGASTTEKVAFLKKEHPELRRKEVAAVLGVSPRTVQRCTADLRRSSRVVGRAAPYKALEGDTRKSAAVVSLPQGRSAADHDDCDPSEDILHDTYPDGRPCVVDGFPFDFQSALKENLARHALKAKVPAPPRPASPRFDGLRPTFFPPRPEATVEEAWHALGVLRVNRRGDTCTEMEMVFLLDHFPNVPAKGEAEMVGVSASTVRRRKADRGA